MLNSNKDLGGLNFQESAIHSETLLIYPVGIKLCKKVLAYNPIQYGLLANLQALVNET